MIGWPMSTRQGRWIVIVHAAVVLSALFAEAAPDPAAIPDDDFLEFLGSWSIGDAHSRWFDPFEMDEMTTEELSKPLPQRPGPAPADQSKTRPSKTPAPAQRHPPGSIEKGKDVRP
jgi:hypothetical protein